MEEPDVKQTWRQPFELLLTTTSSNKTPVQRVVLADKGTSKHKQARPGVFVKRYVAAQLGLTKYNVSRQRRSSRAERSPLRRSKALLNTAVNRTPAAASRTPTAALKHCCEKIARQPPRTANNNKEE